VGERESQREGERDREKEREQRGETGNYLQIVKERKEREWEGDIDRNRGNN